MAFNKAKAMQEAEKLIGQGKIAQAIKQYNFILERDPADVSLLNNIGDLYFRDKNVPEALKCFHKLADAYVKDGFTLKAIAINRKISKIDPSTVEPLIKLAELYVLQGLGREAREQYAQAVEFYRKKNQPDRALDIFRKIVALDPENKTFRTRLAEYAEQLGRKEEAASAYLELAEVAFRGGDIAGGEPALKKALELGAKSNQAFLLEARLALSKQEYGQVEKIIDSTPELKASAPGRQVLLEAYLAAQKLELAEKLVVDVFNANPADFSPVASFSALCTKKGNVDAAVKLLGEVADVLIDRKETGPMMEVLRQVWAKTPDHIATLELIHRISKATADEFALPEVLGALGRAYEQSGDLEKAETVYRELVGRTPGNEEYQRLLNGVLEKQGKEVEVPSPAVLAGAAMEIPAEVEAAPAPPAAEAEQAEMVKEALENSDLFSRYGLMDKAVGELEKVLAVYPEQADIHQRILEICHRSQPVRAGQAAEVLAKIYTKQGDLAGAKKYQELAAQLASGVPSAEVPLPPVAVEAPPPPPPPAPAPVSMEFDLAEVFPVSAPEEAPKEAPREVPLDLSVPVSAPPPVAPAEGLELSADLEALLAGPETPVVEKEVAPFNYDEARLEIDFYLGQGFLDEARSAVQALEEKFPGNSYVAELRQRVDTQAGAPAVAPAEVAAPPAAETVEAAAAEWELPSTFAGPTPAEVVPEVPLAPVEAVVPSPVVEPLPPPPPPEAAAVAAGPPSAEAPTAGGDFLGSLVGDLEAGLEGFGERTPPPSAQPTAQAQPASGAASGGEAASFFSGLLEELGEGAAGSEAEEDPEKHYNLGVAFREMGLLDEAIGEFQKVVKGTQKDKFPPNFLQACSLLAVCFTDKGMPAIAVKWYKRALELPDLDEESTLALQYDLGVAYEQAGDTRNALERFSEVYSQNIDYRDVAEKIRTLQKKAQ
jgi:tetratricopeptide (TPR) repeat protein